MLICVR
jgi:hypothetical protein